MKKYNKPEASLLSIELEDVVLSSGIGGEKVTDVSVGWDDIFPGF